MQLPLGKAFLEANQKRYFCGNKPKEIFEVNGSLEAINKYWQGHQTKGTPVRC